VQLRYGSVCSGAPLTERATLEISKVTAMGWRDLFGGHGAQTTEDLRREAEAARYTPPPPAPPAPAQPVVTSEITRLVHSGEKIEAIKLYRTLHSVGLKEAKDAIDAIARGESPAGNEVGQERAPATASGNASDAGVHALLANGDKIAAIKLYRELHGVGLAEAKAAVDAMGGPQG
jgi:ribosomal protein L7/L12